MATRVDNELSGAVIGAAIKVHRELGPGLEEPIYQEALVVQLLADGISHHPQWPLPLHYQGTHLDCGYRPDIFIPQRLIVELKAVEAIHPIHEAQLLTYLRLTGTPKPVSPGTFHPVAKSGQAVRVPQDAIVGIVATELGA